MGEKRNLQSIRYIYIFAILVNLVLNINFCLGYLGVFILPLYLIDLDSVVRLSYFMLLFLAFVAATCIKINISEEDKESLIRKMKPMYSGHVFFITYIIVALIVVRYRPIILSAIVMEIMFIGITIITRKIVSLGLSDRQLKWKKAWAAPGSDGKESNFTWRYKIWLRPHVKVPFSKRWKGPMRLIYDFALIYGFILTKGTIIEVLFIILLLPDIISWFEGLLGAQTSLKGICTGIVEKRHNSSSSNLYYVVYVTDYEHEREIKFIVDKNISISENSTVTVVHGILSKRVLYVEGIYMNIR